MTCDNHSSYAAQNTLYQPMYLKDTTRNTDHD